MSTVPHSVSPTLGAAAPTGSPTKAAAPPLIFTLERMTRDLKKENISAPWNALYHQRFIHPPASHKHLHSAAAHHGERPPPAAGRHRAPFRVQMLRLAC